MIRLLEKMRGKEEGGGVVCIPVQARRGILMIVVIGWVRVLIEALLKGLLIIRLFRSRSRLEA
jgi:hypothetical protein